MSAIELWTCDWHADPPESDDDFVHEDTAFYGGWVRIERDVDEPSALNDGKTWKRHEVQHVCADCLKDPECLEWIEDGGFAPYFDDDRERIEKARAAVLALSEKGE